MVVMIIRMTLGPSIFISVFNIHVTYIRNQMFLSPEYFPNLDFGKSRVLF